MRSRWIEKFGECFDFSCLSNVLHECYEECDEELQGGTWECISDCNMLFEEYARDM